MCLTKINKRKVFLTDTYVIKSSPSRAFDTVFISMHQDFCYIKHKLHKKSKLTRFFARYCRILNGQVYHAHSIERSKQIAEWYRESSHNEHRYGIFMIPAGTVYYEGDDSDLGVFAIRYAGALTEYSKSLILNQ